MKKALSSITLTIYIIFLSISNFWFSRNANIDPIFGNWQNGFNDKVTTLSIQNDEKILVGGAFSSYKGQAAGRLARIDINWNLDSNFNPWHNQYNPIVPNTILAQSNWDIAVGGAFWNFAGQSVANGFVLNSDWSTKIAQQSRFNWEVGDMIEQSDWKIIIVGSFSSFIGQSSKGIARANNNRTNDSSFNIGRQWLEGFGKTIAIQEDGKIIVGGDFTKYKWQNRNRIVRINSDWSIDTTFGIGNWFNNIVNSIAIQEDGKIIVGGNFTSYNSQSTNRIIRLNPDGSIDSSFNIGAGFNGEVTTIAIQEDGKIIVGGSFTSYNSQTANRIVRLNSDWSFDDSFKIWAWFNNSVSVIKIKKDWTIIVWWEFTTYNWQTANNIVALVWTSPVYIPNTNNSTTIKNEFIKKWYEDTNNNIFGNVLSGSNKISFRDTNGNVPAKIDILSDAGLLSLNTNTQITNTTNSTNFTGIINPIQTYQWFSIINNEPVISMISVWNEEIGLSLNNNATISLPVSNIPENSDISIYSSNDWIQRTYEKKWDLSIQNNTTIVSFETNHFSYFAATQDEEEDENWDENWNENWEIEASLKINNWNTTTESPNVLLSLSASWASQMRFKNESLERSSWENFATSKNRILSDGFWTKTVYAQLDVDRNIITLQESIFYWGSQWTGDIDVSLTITWWITECSYSTNIDLGTQWGNLDSQRYNFSGTFSPSTRYCADYIWLDWRAFSIQASDLSNQNWDIISGSNILISNDTPIVKWNSACAGYNGSGAQFYDTPLTLIEKISGNDNSACKVELPNVSLEVAVPAHQAPWRYSGTITITIPNWF